jgi:hypothetical protein
MHDPTGAGASQYFGDFRMNTLLRLLAGIAALALSGAALATPSLAPGSTLTDPTGIDNLVVDGKTYDVTFSINDYLRTFLFGPDFTTTSGADDAASAVATFFTGAGVTGLDGNPCGNGATVAALICQIYVPSGASGGLALGSQAHDQGAGWYEIGPEKLVPDTDTLGAVGVVYNEWAVFTRTTPSAAEPTTLVLFGLGLVGVALSRRRLTR